MSVNRDYTIDKLKYILSIGVVYIHTFSFTPSPNEETVAWNSSIFDFVRIFISQGLTRFCIPLFAFISGYFFFKNGFDIKKYMGKIKAKSFTLLVPYLLWCTVAFFVSYLFFYLRGESTSIIDFYNLKGSLSGIFWGGGGKTPMDAPLWYIRDLMTTIVLSPILFLVIKYLKIYGVLIVGFLYILFVQVPFTSITILFFFMLGGFRSLNNKIIYINFSRKSILHIGALIALIAAVLLYGSNDYYYGYFIRIYGILGSYSVLTIVGRLKNKTISKIPDEDKGPFSFFLYASHYFTVLPVLYIISIRFPYWNNFGYILMFLITPFLVIIVTYPIYMLLKRYTPFLLSLLIGYRNNEK